MATNYEGCFNDAVNVDETLQTTITGKIDALTTGCDTSECDDFRRALAKSFAERVSRAIEAGTSIRAINAQMEEKLLDAISGAMTGDRLVSTAGSQGLPANLAYESTVYAPNAANEFENDTTDQFNGTATRGYELVGT